MAAAVLRRTDPKDGLTRTLSEVCALYEDELSPEEVQAYWRDSCVPAEAGSSASSSGPAAARPRPSQPEAAGLALLPCEASLAPLLERHAALRASSDHAAADEVHLQILREHPFVVVQVKDVPQEALASEVTCKASNFKMDVPKFRKWLRTPEGKPFEERGQGFDDACYLTSVVLRSFMPRGYTSFAFQRAGQKETVQVVLRGFFKFTGLTAADEDEESGATDECDSFMFRGYKRADASRFAVTTKSNGENAKYTARKVFGEWYIFSGSKNTGYAWRLGTDVAQLHPIPAHDSIAAVGPKIINHINRMIGGLPEDSRTGLLEAIDESALMVMVEFNDPDHEHIFPIPKELADHVAVLDRHGFPLPQRDANALFKKFGLPHVACEVHADMKELESVMENTRARTDIEGAVIYLEREDDTAVGLVKVKSDHYVVARRTREVMRARLINAVGKGTNLDDALNDTRKQLRAGMKNLTHVGGCKDKHQDWAECAIGFAECWARARRACTGPASRKAVADEFGGRFGSLYHAFWTAWQQGDRQPKLAVQCDLGQEGSASSEENDEDPPPSGKGRGKGRKPRRRKPKGQ